MRAPVVPAAALLLAACANLDGLSSGARADAGTPVDAGAALVGADADADADAGGGVTPTQATLVVVPAGTGVGAVTSTGLEIDCGNQCTHAFASGTSVDLGAVALADSAFTGWGAPCTGTGICVVVLAGDVTLTANFAATVLDIDGNGLYEASNDGKMAVAISPGLTGTSLTDGAIGQGARRADATSVLAYLAKIRLQLDIDDNGNLDGLTDGLLVERYMSGLRGDALVANAVGTNAKRDTAAKIEAYLQTLTPAP